jgi:hypothetical protein
MNLLHRGPEGLRKAKEELERLNEEWRKGSSFSKEAIEGIEGALLAAKGTSGERLTPDAIKRLVPGILANAVKHGQYAMTEQQAEAAGSQIAEFILKGGRGSLEALGITVDKSEVNKWMKEHYGVMGRKGKLGKPEELTPAEAAEFLRAKLGGGGKDVEALATAKGEAAAQPAEVARSFEEMATRIGTSMERAFQPLARMMNIILGDDPSGKGSPLDTFLDTIDAKAKEFDNWVRSNFMATWQNFGKTLEPISAAFNQWAEFNRKIDWMTNPEIWGAIANAWNGILSAITGVAQFTAEKMPMLDLGTNFKSIGETMVKIWGDLAGIFKDLSPIINVLAGTAFVALEAAVKDLAEGLKMLEAVLHTVKDLMDVVFHPPTLAAAETGYQAYLATHPGVTREQYEGVLKERRLHPEQFVAKGPVELHQAGGIFTTPHVGMVAEAGPEAVVPLGGAGAAGIMEQLFGWLNVKGHAEKVSKDLEKGTEASTQTLNIFQQLPDLAQQMITVLSQGMLGLGGGGVPGGGIAPGGEGTPGAGGPIRAEAYGPSQGEYTHSTLYGPAGNRLVQGDYAVSPDMAAGHSLGQNFTFRDSAGQVHQGRFADYSYKTAGNPNYRTIEQWNGRDLGHVSNLTWMAEGGIVHQRMLSWLGERGSEAVIPLTRSPRALSLLEHTSSALGVGGPNIGGVNLTINVSGAGAEAGEAIQTAALRAQEQLETMLEDLLRRHRREEFA